MEFNVSNVNAASFASPYVAPQPQPTYFAPSYECAQPSYGYEHCCEPSYGYGHFCPEPCNNSFILIVVLFILLIIVGTSFIRF